MTTYNKAEQVLDGQDSFRAVLHTSLGDIELFLNAEHAPITANNFAFLASEGFWTDTIIHRVVPGFVVQMGDPTGTGTGGPGYTFEDELSLAKATGYPRGTLAMANRGPDTNGCQFFICLSDVQLPPQYSVFGNVVEGMNVVDEIAAKPTGAGDRPVEDIILQSVTLDLDATE